MNHAETIQILSDTRPVVTAVVWTICGFLGYWAQDHITYHGRHIL